MMVAVGISETLVNFQKITQCNIAEVVIFIVCFFLSVKQEQLRTIDRLHIEQIHILLNGLQYIVHQRGIGAIESAVVITQGRASSRRTF